MSLGTQTARGALWNYLSFTSGKLLTFVSTVVLARLLVPDQFGQVAVALMAIQYLEAVGDLGISAALIYQRENLERAKNIAFLISLVMGVVLTSIGLLAAPLIAAYFGDPSITPMLQVLALTLLINALGQTQMALLAKELRFKQKLLPDLSRSLVKGLGAIILAFLGFGAWSLIWGQVFATLATTIVLWLISPWRPRFDWDWALAKQMLHYGVQSLGIELLAVLWGTIDYIIIAKFLGQAELGLYQQAFRVSDLLILSVCFTVGRVLFPSYAQIRTDMEAIQQGFFSAMRYISMITLPLSVGVCAVAPLFVSVVFGPNWLPMIPALQLLAVRAGLSTISFNSGQILRAIGKPGLINYQMVAKLTLLSISVYLAVPYGFVAVAAAHVVNTLIGIAIDFETMRRVIQAPLYKSGQQVWSALVASSVMGVGVSLFVLQVPEAWSIAGLIASTILGVAIYAVVLWLLDRELCRTSLRMIKRVLRPTRSVAVA